MEVVEEMNGESDDEDEEEVRVLPPSKLFIEIIFFL